MFLKVRCCAPESQTNHGAAFHGEEEEEEVGSGREKDGGGGGEIHRHTSQHGISITPRNPPSRASDGPGSHCTSNIDQPDGFSSRRLIFRFATRLASHMCAVCLRARVRVCVYLIRCLSDRPEVTNYLFCSRTSLSAAAGPGTSSQPGTSGLIFGFFPPLSLSPPPPHQHRPGCTCVPRVTRLVVVVVVGPTAANGWGGLSNHLMYVCVCVCVYVSVCLCKRGRMEGGGGGVLWCADDLADFSPRQFSWWVCVGGGFWSVWCEQKVQAGFDIAKYPTREGKNGAEGGYFWWKREGMRGSKSIDSAYKILCRQNFTTFQFCQLALKSYRFLVPIQWDASNHNFPYAQF